MDRDPLPLEQLLYTHEAAECSDLRDRVYALLSLLEHAKNQLEARYDFSPFELMLSVVSVCTWHEYLSTFCTLSFAWFLTQYLDITRSQVHAVLRNPPRSMLSSPATL